MNTSEINYRIDRVSMHPTRPAIAALLALPREQMHILFERADAVRRTHVGDGILLRGIIEFSSYCRNECRYCGLTKKNRLPRYRMTLDEILAAVDTIFRADIRTVVLQSGEDDAVSAAWLASVVSAIHTTYPTMAITLSVGERPRYDYALWRSAGADRYLLKIETSDPAIYESLHPNMSFQNRLRCLRDLKELGYQTGSGVIVGLPGQTTESLSRDVLFFRELDLEMIGIGPLIPHPSTDLAALPIGDVEHVLTMIAVTRLVMKQVHLPATTALGSAGGDRRIDGLRVGANVLMPNFTPAPYRTQYEIYPNKRCVTEAVGSCSSCMDGMAASVGRYIDHGRGDSIREYDARRYA